MGDLLRLGDQWRDYDFANSEGCCDFEKTLEDCDFFNECPNKDSRHGNMSFLATNSVRP